MKTYSTTLAAEIATEMARVIGNFRKTAALIVEDGDDPEMAAMYNDDAAYNEETMNAFAANADIYELEDRIMSQDTMPREEFINVLKMIESSAVIIR